MCLIDVHCAGSVNFKRSCATVLVETKIFAAVPSSWWSGEQLNNTYTTKNKEPPFVALEPTTLCSLDECSTIWKAPKCKPSANCACAVSTANWWAELSIRLHVVSCSPQSLTQASYHISYKTGLMSRQLTKFRFWRINYKKVIGTNNFYKF